MIHKQLAAMELAEQGIVNACIEAYCRHGGKTPPADELDAAFEEVYSSVRRTVVAAGILDVFNSHPVADLEASKELLRASGAVATLPPPRCS